MIDETSAFAKRVKRQVGGKLRECFAVTSLGLEKLTENELAGVPINQPSTEIQPGGVTFGAKLTDLMQANLHLRTATRVLMRMAAFKAEGFSELQRKLAEVPWELFLYRDQKVRIHVASHHSRLYHSRAVAERIDQSLAERQAVMRQAPGGKTEQRVFARIQDNRLTLSLDSSGEPLYKRGVKRHGGAAPLRETLAAAVLSIAGYDPAAPLVDPMCGTGSFSIEAAMIAKKMAAGKFREFAFSGWPAFNPKSWAYLKNTADKRVVNFEEPVIFTSDQNPDCVNALFDCINRHHLSDAIQVQVKNFFDLVPGKWTRQKGLIVLNPPYGIRIGERGNSTSFIKELARKLKSEFAGWQAALLVPGDAAKSLRPLRLNTFRLMHGGLDINLFYGKIS